LAELLARPEYLGVPADLIEVALSGRLDLGGGRTANDRDFLYFSRHAANRPEALHGQWVYAQMVRWGQTAPSDAAQAAAARTFREDLYERCLPDAAPAAPRVAAFDGVSFSDAELDGYAQRFAISTASAGASAES